MNKKKTLFTNATNKKAVSALEYMFVMFFIASTFFVFQKYLARGLSGQWRSAGDAFGHGKQYDPEATEECFFDSVVETGSLNVFTMPGWLVPCCTLDDPPCNPVPAGEPICDTCAQASGAMNIWVDSKCFRDNCDCDLPKDHLSYDEMCRICIADCRSANCNSNMCWDVEE